jgi:hypothetical protein
MYSHMTDLGFTLSLDGRWACQGCAAVSIQGRPCHETGCPEDARARARADREDREAEEWPEREAEGRRERRLAGGAL